MSWESRLKLSIDLLKQTIDTFNGQEENEILKFALEDLQEYTSSEDFNSMSENDKEHETIVILNSQLSLCGSRYVKYMKKTGRFKFKQVSPEEAKKTLITDYFRSYENGNDDIASMNINDWVEQSGIIIMDDIASSTNEE